MRIYNLYHAFLKYGAYCNTEVYCAVYNYAGKVDLSKDYWNPKRKLGNHAFLISEII